MSCPIKQNVEVLPQTNFLKNAPQLVCLLNAFYSSLSHAWRRNIIYMFAFKNQCCLKTWTDQQLLRIDQHKGLWQTLLLYSASYKVSLKYFTCVCLISPSLSCYQDCISIVIISALSSPFVIWHANYRFFLMPFSLEKQQANYRSFLLRKLRL